MAEKAKQHESAGQPERVERIARVQGVPLEAAIAIAAAKGMLANSAVFVKKLALLRSASEKS